MSVGVYIQLFSYRLIKKEKKGNFFVRFSFIVFVESGLKLRPSPPIPPTLPTPPNPVPVIRGSLRS